MLELVNNTVRIVILSRKLGLYSTRRLVEVARARGHRVRVVDTLRCYMSINPANPCIHYRGKNLAGFDAVLPRIGASITGYGTAVVRQFETMGVYSLNSADGIARARDKLRCAQLLAQAGIAMPVTGFADSPDDIDDLIELVGGAPLVIKLLEGAQGIGVVLGETRQSAASVIQAFYGLRANIMIQSFIKEAAGADIRCLVVGDQVVAAIGRQARQGEFRSNLHQGGMASPVSITSEERAIALRATQVVGLAVAGVDILRSAQGPLVIEVNASPGLEGIETTTKVDVAGAMVAYIEHQLNTGRY